VRARMLSARKLQPLAIEFQVIGETALASEKPSIVTAQGLCHDTAVTFQFTAYTEIPIGCQRDRRSKIVRVPAGIHRR
jgi:hypothetical protein